MRIVNKLLAKCYLNISTQVIVFPRFCKHIFFTASCIGYIFLNMMLISGCTTTKQSTHLPGELQYPSRGKIIQVVMNTGDNIRFDEDGGTFIEITKAGRLYRGIVGVKLGGEPMDINIDSVLEVQIERQETNVLGNVFIITLAVPAVLLSALIVELTIHPPHSCPYVYSFDGVNYIFDGQSYAGAISRVLKRTDHVRLDFIKPIDNAYHLILRNDPPDETQFTDEVKLLVVDHKPEDSIAFGYDSKLYSVKNLNIPLNVVDNKQEDVTHLFTKRDSVSWQSKRPTDSSYKLLPLRDRLTFAFAKPKNVRNALLFIHGGTSYLGSSMIRQFISMQGNHLNKWYKSLEQNGTERKELFQLIEGQELYHLKVSVLEDKSWITRGLIRSGSSLSDEDRIIPLDLSSIQGDTLWIRLNPPRGFWKFDFVAVSYEFDLDPHAIELSPKRAEDEDGVNIREVLKLNDEQYYIQQKPNELSKFWFDVPPQAQGTSRSLFVQTSGYYIIKTDTTQPEQTDQLRKLATKDNAAVEYALDEYLRWIKEYSILK